MKKALIILSVPLLLGGNLLAQAFNPAQQQPTVAANFVEPVDVSNDETVQLINDIQDTTRGSDRSVIEQPTPKTTAEDYAMQFLSDKLGDGSYDPDKKRMFVATAVGMDVKNPAISDDFIDMRNMMYTRAVLEAKSLIAEALNGEMSASDKLDIPGSDIHEQLGKSARDAKRGAEYAHKQLNQLASELGHAKSEADAGVTFEDRLNRGVDALIKKLDSSYNANQLDAAKKQRFAQAKADYAEAMQEYQRIQKEADKLNNELLSTQTSKLEITASMPLVGCTLVQSYESWIDGKYEVAVVLGWSKKAEQAAHASLLGAPIITKANPNKLSHKDWIKSQDLDVICGPRSYTDNAGKRWTFGIHAVSSDGLSSAEKNRMRILGPREAKKTCMMALVSDIGSKVVAEQVLQERASGLNQSTAETAKSMEAKMSQEFVNADMAGINVVYSKKLIHPISQREMTVYVAAADPALQKVARQLVAEAYAVSAEIRAKNNESRVFKDNLGKGNIPQSAKDAVRIKPRATQPLAPLQPSTGPRKPGAPKSGVFGGDSSGDIDDF
jgi:hypothetical protein